MRDQLCRTVKGRRPLSRNYGSGAFVCGRAIFLLARFRNPSDYAEVPIPAGTHLGERLIQHLLCHQRGRQESDGDTLTCW